MDKAEFDRRKSLINELIHDKDYVPMKEKEIAMLLNIPKELREELSAVLTSLVREGKIGVSSKGKYQKIDNLGFSGILECTRKGFGFVKIEDKDEEIFISEKDMADALNGDRVFISIIHEKEPGKKAEGRVIKVLERNLKTIVGTYEKRKNYGFVIPDNLRINSDIFIPQGKSLSAVTGHKVIVSIDDFGGKDRNPEGHVERILGHVNDPGVDILSIVYDFDIPSEFPCEVMESLTGVPDELSGNEYEGREDLRDVMMVTIDGEDAKDLDDAVSLTFENGIYHLGVHIADVSEYVKEQSPLDKEALNRGTSVYLVDRVIPMLPHKLSNGICSLNQGVDRLALSCLMDIDKSGAIIGHRICESVINVNRRMSYNEVKSVITDKDADRIQEFGELSEMFMMMNELAGLLRKRRYQRGGIDFDFPECKINLNEEGEPVAILPRERNDATRLIEDFMLAANETVAEDIFWQELPFVYRVHDNPDPDRLLSLSTFINNFGFSLRVTGDEIHPKKIQELLNKIEGSPEEMMIARLTLRSMKRAQYSTECLGHFGLAAKYYCHFTSPIRRYPDLQIHRIIKENLRGKLDEKRIAHYNTILGEVAKSTSLCERRADDCEREVDKLKKAEYMYERIGQTFEGVINSVTAFGIYVELPDTIEGMVHVNNMPEDRFIFHEEDYSMVGETTGITYKLGQRITVKCIGADILARTIDFMVVRGRKHE